MYLIYGNDHYQINLYKEKLLSEIISNPLEYIEYNLDKVNFNEIISNFWVNSLFNLKRTFVIVNFDLLFLDINKNQYNNLLKLEFNKNNIIFIFNNSNIPKNKNFKEFMSKCHVLVTKEITLSFARNNIKEYLKKEHAVIEPKALDYLISSLPMSLDIINNELKKIVSINKNITFKLIINNLTNYLEGDLFKFINSIFESNDNFMDNYNKFYDNNFDKMSFINLLFSNVINIRKIKILKINNKNITNNMQISPYRLKCLKKISCYWSFNQLNDLIKLLFDYDYNAKTNPLNIEQYFKIILLKMKRIGMK